MKQAYKVCTGHDIGISLDLSYADKLEPGKSISTFAEMDAALDEGLKVPLGYEKYFERKQRFKSMQDRKWFARFKPM